MSPSHHNYLGELIKNHLVYPALQPQGEVTCGWPCWIDLGDQMQLAWDYRAWAIFMVEVGPVKTANTCFTQSTTFSCNWSLITGISQNAGVICCTASCDLGSVRDIGILDNNQLARWSKPLRPRTWIGSPSRKLQAASRKQQATSSWQIKIIGL